MSINRENCEAWFLDYYEGNLSKEGVEVMYAFLILNPDLREVFDSYETGVDQWSTLIPSKEKEFFPGKEDLKKSVEVEDGISESNYEEYFIGAVENVLSAEEKNQLEKFLLQFPTKRKELDVLRSTILLPENEIIFENKNSLKKSILISEENFEEMAIASVEGLLNAEEEKVLLASMAGNAEQKKQFERFAKTKLVADASIIFEDKESLKREEKDRGIFWWMLDVRFASAAAVALLIGIFFWLDPTGNYSGTVLKSNSFANNLTARKNNSDTQPVLAKTDSASDSITNIATNNTHHKNVLIPINIHGKSEQLANNNAHHKNILIPINVPHKDGVATVDQADFNAIAVNKKLISLKTNSIQSVDFSGEFYDAVAVVNNSANANQSISPAQYAMRWMKNKLDGSANSKDENDVYSAVAQNKSENVTGFDLTSSAVNAFSEATGANMHLRHETTGTTFTVGKYKVWLNRK